MERKKALSVELGLMLETRSGVLLVMLHDHLRRFREASRNPGLDPSVDEDEIGRHPLNLNVLDIRHDQLNVVQLQTGP